MTLQGKVAIVTGGNGGIGSASALLLAEQGASVVVNYRSNAVSAEEVVAQIRAHDGQAIAVQADLQEQEQIEKLIHATIDTYGQIDILVHATSPSTVIKPFAVLSWEEFAQGVNNELKTAFLMTKAVLPIMQQQHYGRIVYIGSGVAKTVSFSGAISLATAKAGLNAFSRYIAKEYGPSGITANVVAPGMVETKLSARMPAEHKQRLIATTPVGRIAQPEDIANVVAFFASDASGFMTGTYAPVNGGQAMD